MKFEDITEDFTEEMAQSLNVGLINLSFKDNFKSDIVTIHEIGAGAEFLVSHNLKKTPEYRIILRQEGGEYITDSIGKWNDKAIYLINNGTTALKKIVLLIM